MKVPDKEQFIKEFVANEPAPTNEKEFVQFVLKCVIRYNILKSLAHLANNPESILNQLTREHESRL